MDRKLEPPENAQRGLILTAAGPTQVEAALVWSRRGRLDTGFWGVYRVYG